MRVELTGLDNVLAVMHPKVYQKSLNRTVNDIGSRVKTHGTKRVKETYNISAKEVKDEKFMKVRKSNFSNMSYYLDIRSKRLNAKRFGAKKLAKKGHVSVLIKKANGRKQLKRAFFAKSGALLARDKNSQKIRAVKSVSVAQMFNKKILKEMDELATKEFSPKFQSNFNHYIGKV